MKRTAISVIALSGALALGACGSDTAATGTDTSTAPSAAATAEDAAALSAGDTVPVSEIGARSAAAVAEKATAHMTMTAADVDGMEADVDFGSASPRMSMTMTAEGETLEMVYLDKVMYMGGDTFEEVTGGKHWIKIDPEGDDMMSQMMGPMLGQMESSMGNPAEQLEAFGDSEAKVVSVEGGVTTYEVTITKAQLKKALDADEESLPGLTEEALKDVPEKGLTYTMSLDAQDLPQSLSMEIQGQSLEMTYSKWGEPVDIAAPAAQDVGTFEMPDLG